MPFYCAEEVDRMVLLEISSLSIGLFSNPEETPEKDKAYAMGAVYGLTTAWNIMRHHSTELLPGTPFPLDPEVIIDA